MKGYSLRTKLMLAAAIYFLVVLMTSFLWLGLTYGALFPFAVWIIFVVYAVRLIREHRDNTIKKPPGDRA